MNGRFKIIYFAALSLILLLGACSSPVSEKGGEESREEPTESIAAKEKKIPEAPTDIEGIMMQNPGIYSGENYDQEKLKKALNELPDNLSADEAYNHLIYLLGENYQPMYQKLNALDPSIQVNLQTPQAGSEPSPFFEQLNVEILLDASGSMAGRVPGGIKMDLAKEAIREFVAELPKEANVSLRVYGHTGSNSSKDKDVSCKGNEIVYPMGPYDATSFKQALDKFKPTGWTPLAAAIQEAQKDLEQTKGEGVRNIVYVVSDGVETCGGDPVKAAKGLHDSDIRPLVNIIGFDVDDAGHKQLKKVADAAGGYYKSINSKNDLEKYLQAEKDRLKQEWRAWGTKSYLEAHSQWSDKIDDLSEILNGKQGLNTLKEQEIDRLYNAIEYLDLKNKLQDKHSLSKKVSDRDFLISKYSSDRYHSISGSLKKSRDDAQRQVRDKEKEMTDQ